MTYEANAPIMRRAREVKDKSYRRFPLGQEAGHFLRSLQAEAKSKNTLLSYETVLRLFTIDHPDAQSLADFESPAGCDAIADFIAEHWADAKTSTLIQRRAVLESFFEWGKRTNRISWSPMEGVRRPRRRKTERYLPPQVDIQRLVSAQKWLRDQAGILLMARLGLRRDELRLTRIGDFDLARGLVFIRGKGEKDVSLPLDPYADVRETVYLHVTGESRGEDEYLLYPKRWPLRPLSSAGIHNWFKRCLEVAELKDFPMHSLRHAAIDEVRERTGNLEAARQLARHESLATTEAYLHASRSDLIAAMRAVEEKRSV